MSAESKKLRAAVIGAGFAHSPDGRELWGVRAIIPALKALSDQYELVAVCTAHQETAEESAKHFNVPHAYWDYHRLLEEMSDVDVVMVAVRPVLHHQVTMAALAAGKHVYCELPLGTSSQQAQEMHQLARAKGLRTGVGWQRVHIPSVLRMRELVREGYVGRVLHWSKSKFTPNNIAPRPSHHQWISQVDQGGRPSFRTGEPLAMVSFVLDADVQRLTADAELMVRERPAYDSTEPLRSTQVNNVSYLVRMTDESMGVLHLSMTSWNATGDRLE
ncbi:MAG: Gfo/Idh/MocA family oxidoreductase, partial [Dehalococcoidia bacterium]